MKKTETGKNRLRSLLSLVMCIAFALSSVQMVFAEGETSGVFGTNNALTWKLNDGTLTISGTGEMPSYDNNRDTNTPPWESYKDQIENVVIEDGITKIGGRTFQGYGTALKTVTMADTVTASGGYVFNNCKALTSIKISENLSTIPEGFLATTTALKTITIPYKSKLATDALKRVANDVTIQVYYGSAAHTWAASSDVEGETPVLMNETGSESSARKYTVLPIAGTEGQNITWSIADNTLTISGSGSTNSYVGANAGTQPWLPYAESFDTVVIESGITNLGHRLFQSHTTIKTVVMADTVTNVGEYLFNGCTSLTSVTLSENISTLNASSGQASYPFNGATALKEVTIPYAMTVGENTFRKTSTELTINVYEGSAAYNWATQNGTDTTGKTPAIKDDNVGRTYKVLPLGGQVTEDITWTIKNGKLTISGSGKMPEYDPSKDTGKTPWDAYIDQITSIEIGEGITRIGTRTFQSHTSLTTVTMANTVKQLGSYAFNNCQKLSSVTLSDNLEGIGDYVFNNDAALKELTIPGATILGEKSLYKTPYDMIITVYAGSAAYDWATGGEGNETPSVENMTADAEKKTTRTYRVISSDGTEVDYYVDGYSAVDATEAIGVWSKDARSEQNKVIFAAYDGETGRLTSVSAVDVMLSAGINKVNAGAEFAPAEGDTIMVMLWANMNDITPLAEPYRAAVISE